NRGVPLVCLVREPASAGLLKGLRAHLHGAHPGRVPHAYHRFPDVDVDSGITGDEGSAPSPLDLVSAVLVRVARDLSSGANSRYGRHEFPRFELVYWLMNQETGGDQESAATLFSRLRERHLRRNSGDDLIPREALDTAAAAAPWWARVVLKLAPSFWFRAKLGGLAPGGEYRWLLNQPYLAPHDPGNVVGFAERLNSTLVPGQGAESREDPDQLAALLVNAFLEDVRQTYQRSLRRVLSGRRTAYPVVMLDGIRRDNGGYRLLKMINDVRNDTGAFDPLVVISASEKVPPDAAAADDRAPTPVLQANQAYETWTRKLAINSRTRRPTAWFLPLRVPPVTFEPGEVPPTATLTVRSAPLWSRASVLTIVGTVLLASVLAFGYWRVDTFVKAASAEREAHCGRDKGDPNFSTLQRIGGECIGVSDDSIPLFDRGDDTRKAKFEKFDNAQKKIADQNNAVLEAHQAHMERPYATVVYVSALSGQNDDLTTNTARLMGVAAKQAQLLERTGQKDPLVRVLLGNAGEKMQHGGELVDALRALVERDKSIVGVLGMAQSRKPTLDTIRKLGDIGLPVVAATLSVDSIPQNSALYFQVSPNNDREARVAASYARKSYPGKSGAVIVHSDSDDETLRDTYSVNLGTDFDAQFRALGFAVTEKVYSTEVGVGKVDVREIGQGLCGAAHQDEVVVFAGRPDEFRSLLDGIASVCKDDAPVLLAGDDVMRYVADGQLRDQHPDIAYDVLSFAVGTTACGGSTAMYKTMVRIFDKKCEDLVDLSLGGQSELAFDTLEVYSRAILQLKTPHFTSGHVWKAIGDIGRVKGDGAGSEFSPLSGESGEIAFLGGQVPHEKRISVIHVDKYQPPVLAVTCEPDSVDDRCRTLAADQS
ncbi:MAG: ABC transporter substrate-binding protein, partial [Umezawaea sp.]